MIKLTVHDSVEAALQKAFPKPAAAAKRALTKYISVVESMLFDALQRGLTPEQRKLGLYAISLEQLAKKAGRSAPKRSAFTSGSLTTTGILFKQWSWAPSFLGRTHWSNSLPWPQFKTRFRYLCSHFLPLQPMKRLMPI